MFRSTQIALLNSLFVLTFSGDAATAESDYLPRKNYGAKFEPVGGILHGAGQTYFRDLFSNVCQTGDCLSEAAERYTDVLGSERTPLLFMDYNNANDGANWYAGLNSRIEALETNYNRQLVPQLGTFLQPGATLLTDSQVNNIVNGLASLNRPVFYRPGYEANGPWFGLDPEAYKANYRTLSDAIRAADLPVAMVWNVVVGDGGNHSQWNAPSLSAEDYYPGDEYVDWWSFNVFGDITFDNPFWNGEVSEFLTAADEAGFPVMIGEATPQFIGGDDVDDWTEWYEPFFNRIKNNPGIKAHTYINWDWAQTAAQEGWQNWGDARLENANATVRSNYLSELSDPIYVHSGSELPSFFSQIAIPGDYNQDGTVNVGDYTLWLSQLGSAGGAFSADGTGDDLTGIPDGDVDLFDYQFWKQEFGNSAAQDGQSSIPEPAGCALVLLACLFMTIRRRQCPCHGGRLQ